MEKIRLGKFCVDKIENVSAQGDFDIDYIDISSVDNIIKKITGFNTFNISEAPSRAKQMLEKNDVLVSTVRPNLNTIALCDIDSENTLVGSTGFCVLRGNDKVDSRYLFYFCQSKYFINELMNVATGASYPAVSKNNVKNVLIPNITLQKQTEIVEILDLIRGILNHRKEQLILLDDLIKSRFVEMFGEQNFPTTKLIDVIIKGAGLSYGIVVPGENVVNGIPMVRPSDFKNGRLFLNNVYCVDPEIEKKYAKTRLMGDEILVQVIGQPGQIMLTNQECVGMNVTRNLAVVRQNNKIVNKYYVKEYLESKEAQKFMLGGTKQSTLKQLPLMTLKELEVPLPPLNLQNQFATFVQQVDKLKAEVQKSLDETQVLFDSLVQQYFT